MKSKIGNFLPCFFRTRKAYNSLFVSKKRALEKTKTSFKLFPPRLFKASDGKEGFIALISILIIGAVVLIISLGLLSRSYDETTMGFGEQESYRALSLANLCAELALIKLQSILNYAGGESIIEGGDSCDILAIEGMGNLDRTVKAQSTISKYSKKVKIEVSQISPVLKITSWEEISDF